jgi:hypothetical protein
VERPEGSAKGSGATHDHARPHLAGQYGVALVAGSASELAPGRAFDDDLMQSDRRCVDQRDGRAGAQEMAILSHLPRGCHAESEGISEVSELEGLGAAVLEPSHDDEVEEQHEDDGGEGHQRREHDRRPARPGPGWRDVGETSDRSEDPAGIRGGRGQRLERHRRHGLGDRQLRSSGQLSRSISARRRARTDSARPATRKAAPSTSSWCVPAPVNGRVADPPVPPVEAAEAVPSAFGSAVDEVDPATVVLVVLLGDDVDEVDDDDVLLDEVLLDEVLLDEVLLDDEDEAVDEVDVALMVNVNPPVALGDDVIVIGTSQ